MQRKGSAVWKGGLKDGNGQVSTGSGGLAAAPYTFASRFETGGKTDPEELVAAAHHNDRESPKVLGEDSDQILLARNGRHLHIRHLLDLSGGYVFSLREQFVDIIKLSLW